MIEIIKIIFEVKCPMLSEISAFKQLFIVQPYL